MSNERKPMLSDDRICDMTWEYEQKDSDDPAALYERGLNDARRHYENLITTGKLRVVEEVEQVPPIWGCSACGWDGAQPGPYCPGCGNKIKQTKQ